MNRWSFQPGLFDGLEGKPYEDLVYLDSMLKDRLIIGDSDHATEYIANCRRGGYDGDFNVWDYELLLESYRSGDKELMGLMMPSGLEVKLLSDLNGDK